MSESPASIAVSVVIPVFNEAPSLRPLHDRLTAALDGLGRTYEIILIDDGSCDDTPAVMEQLSAEDCRLKAIQFRRNFGKAAALSAGFEEAQGEIVVTMDADLQDDPAEVPQLIAALEAGYDLVSGWKYPRVDPLSKTLPSRTFNWATRVMTGLSLHDMNCGLKAYRSCVVKELQVYGEMHRYIPALAHQRGFRVGEVKVQHHPREFGQSKYGWSRFARGLFDLVTVLFLTQYNRRPLHLFGWIGGLIFLSGILINIYLFVLWSLGQRPIGTRPLFSVGIMLLFMGIQLVSFGLLAELIAKFTASSRDYSIRRRLP